MSAGKLQKIVGKFTIFPAVTQLMINTHRLHINLPIPDHEHCVPMLLALLNVLVGQHTSLSQFHS